MDAHSEADVEVMELGSAIRTRALTKGSSRLTTSNGAKNGFDDDNDIDQRKDCVVRFNWDPTMIDEEERLRARKTQKKMFTTEGLYRGNKVTISLGEKGIIWKLEKRAGSAGDTENEKSFDTECYFYEDVISVAEKASEQLKIIISTCKRYNGSQFKLLELEVELKRHKDVDRWVRYSEKVLRSIKPVLRKVRAYVHTKSGRGNAASVFKERALPLLCKFDVSVVRVTRPSADELCECVLADQSEINHCDALIIVGGDGTVQRLCSILLQIAQKETPKPASDWKPTPACVPICIIPTGFTNDIAFSILGTSDPASSILHMLAGHKKRVNSVCTFTRKANNEESSFHSWCFNASYGLPSAALACLDKYKLFYDSKYEKAMNRALDRKTFTAFSCDLMYKPSPNVDISNPIDEVACCSRCTVCSAAEVDGSTRLSEDDSDSVQEFDPLNNSNSSSTIIELASKDAWSAVKGDYSWVGVYSLTGRSNMTPCGLSPFAHLNDGCIDLVLLSESKKKEVGKFLKKLWSESSHLSLGFVDTYRCTAVKFQPRAASWNKEDDRDEIDFCGAAAQSNQQNLNRNSAEIVLDLLNSGSESDASEESCQELNDQKRLSLSTEPGFSFSSSNSSSNNYAKRKMSLAEKLCDSSDGEMDEKECESDSVESRNTDSRSNDQSSLKSAKDGEDKGGTSSARNSEDSGKEQKKKKKSKLAKLLHTTPGPSSNANYVAPTRLPSEIERERRARKRIEKRNRLAMKEAAKRRSAWNFDYSLIDVIDIEFHCYPNLLEIFCEGIFSDVVADAVGSNKKSNSECK